MTHLIFFSFRCLATSRSPRTIRLLAFACYNEEIKIHQYAGVQSEKAVTVHVKSKQLLPHSLLAFQSSMIAQHLLFAHGNSMTVADLTEE